MKNTIEKALQKQQEAQEKSKAEQASISESDDNASTIEKALAAKENSETTENLPVSDNEHAEEVSSSDNTNDNASNAKPNKYFDIDLDRLRENGFVNLENARTLINEEYREIKRKLLQNAFGPLASTIASSNIIMVSSARPSEGKTFTATNLAISIAAEQDKTVLLVDADVLKPNVLRTLGLEPTSGLMEYLLGKVDDLSEVIHHTNIPKLKIIPAGKSHHLSTELLASTVMKDTVAEFSSRYADRVVIIDTPPLIGINESAVLANLAGQAVIVTEEGRSKMGDIRHAVDRLNPDMAIGFVVNKSTQFSEKGGYYGYQYYGSGDRD
ncbi:XrtA-associated tyrosine autokinase [Glaciecola petra]|uniref:XrtA-associated tyrosine autokinase n=1 Tax=Glaciecola petra TaxID=3075602 RepID=A0ABU2ZLU0_9ALTE|nr:XrtA-associated tyrosine autokinase [Aestuariibacter sp. P117]MDT0593594.1 XrtA-associated tyrosine autokinase [Aestuariibacter sp. P117]